MKNRSSQFSLISSVGAILLVSLSAMGQTSTPVSAPPASENTTVKLPYGVEDVVKLSKAQVSEDVILTFVQNSGTIYNLGPNDVVYLRAQGVSDRVVNVMLSQRKQAAEVAAQSAPAPQQPAYTDAVAAPVYTQPAPTEVPPPAVAVQPAPSTVYVIPYPPARDAYYGYYPPYYSPYYYGGYYGGYYGYGYPRVGVSIGFGFGGHGHYHHHH